MWNHSFVRIAVIVYRASKLKLTSTSIEFDIRLIYFFLGNNLENVGDTSKFISILVFSGILSLIGSLHQR